MCPAIRSSATKKVLPSIVGLPIALFLLAEPMPSRFLAFLVSWTSLSWVSVWGIVFIAKDVVVLVLICAIVLGWEHQNLRSIGLRAPSTLDAISAITTFFLSIWLQATVESFHSNVAPPDASGTKLTLAALLSLPLWFRISGTIVNGISEETISRGFAIERLETITNSTWIGTSIAYSASLLIHVPSYGVVGALSRAPALFVFVCLYLWRRNLPACIFAHVLVDGFSLVLWLILPRVLQVYFWRLA